MIGSQAKIVSQVSQKAYSFSMQNGRLRKAGAWERFEWAELTGLLNGFDSV